MLGASRTAADEMDWRPAFRVQLPDNWAFKTAYSDEFDGVSLEAKKWDDHLPPWGAWTWNRDLVQVREGRLHLGMNYSPHLRDGEALFYEAAVVHTRATPLRYGYFEARIKAAPRWPGVATAFWLFRNTAEYWTEIDVVEMMQRRNTKSIIDHSQYVMRGTAATSLPVRIKREAEVAWDPSAGFHVYSCLWTEQEISYFVDGRILSSEKNDYWHEPMDIVVSVALRQPLVRTPESAGFPMSAEFDYVRVWGPANQ